MSYKRSLERKKRLKRLYDKTKNSYGAGVYFDTSKNRFVRYSVHNEWLKHHCRKTTRLRLKNLSVDSNSAKGTLYKKIYDYWWELL